MGTDVGTDVGTGKNHETGRNHGTDMAQVEGMGTDTWYRDQSRHGHGYGHGIRAEHGHGTRA
jgi:hypothetical protein